MNPWSKETLRSIFLPGGIIFAVAVAWLQSGLTTLSTPAMQFYFYGAFAAGVLLAWRFRASRPLFALLSLLLAQHAIDFFSNGKVAATGPGHIAFEVIAFLLPINLLLCSLARSRGWSVTAAAPAFMVLLLEATFVAILCRPGATTAPALFHGALLEPSWSHWSRIPQPSLFIFLGCFSALLARTVLQHRPMESGLVWSLAAGFAGLQAGGVGRLAMAYFATAGLILAASIVENSYTLAYHDELTRLPGRRAFNEAQLHLEAPYVIAAVDIDHFKSFNDTYGHDTGDEVLRMVATRLARVTGDGQPYRVGGEEFSIVFPRKSIKEVVPHLEALRVAIAEARFRVRGLLERRRAARGTDRRMPGSRRLRKSFIDPRQRKLQFGENELSVTVSIGVAEAGPRTKEVAQVIEAADKALYRAKEDGRNRVETATPARSRTSRARRVSA